MSNTVAILDNSKRFDSLTEGTPFYPGPGEVAVKSGSGSAVVFATGGTDVRQFAPDALVDPYVNADISIRT